jgi:hypothetical protein
LAEGDLREKCGTEGATVAQKTYQVTWQNSIIQSASLKWSHASRFIAKLMKSITWGVYDCH